MLITDALKKIDTLQGDTMTVKGVSRQKPFSEIAKVIDALAHKPSEVCMLKG